MSSGKHVYTIEEAKAKLGDIMFAAWLRSAKKMTTDSEEVITKRILEDFDKIIKNIDEMFDTMDLSAVAIATDLRPEEAYR